MNQRGREHRKEETITIMDLTVEVENLKRKNNELEEDNEQLKKKLKTVENRYEYCTQDKLNHLHESIKLEKEIKEKDEYINNLLENQFQNLQEIKELKRRNAELENAIKDFNI